MTDEELKFCETVVCAGFHVAKYNTFEIVEQCLKQGIPGDFAECGVLYGAHPAIMLYVLRKHGVRDRLVHLFDSFEGIPRASEQDGDHERQIYGVTDGRMVSTGVSVSSVENTVNNLKRWGVYDQDLVRIHKGWFEETLERESASIGRLAILRVDVDLYMSTKAVFTHLYPHVSPGGFVIDDDFGCVACRRAVEEVVGERETVTLVNGQPTTGWWQKSA